MKIYENLWAGYECYFMKIGSAWSSKNEPRKVKVLFVRNYNNKWTTEIGEMYSQDLEDTEHFPIVGKLDLKQLIINAVLANVNLARQGE